MRDFINYFIKFFYKKKISEIEFNNNKIKALITDPIANAWNTNTKIGYTEKTILKFIKIDKIKNVFYFGSHQGIIPIILKKLFLKNSKFVCLEALKHNYDISIENKKLNNCDDDLHIKNYAISEFDGLENFSYFKLNSSKSNNLFFKRKVKSITIKKLMEEHFKPDLIYMDIEGMESNVIKGNKEVLKNKTHVLFLELHGDLILKNYKSSNEEVYKNLCEIYTKIYIINGDKIELIKGKKLNIKKRIYLLCFYSDDLHL